VSGNKDALIARLSAHLEQNDAKAEAQSGAIDSLRDELLKLTKQQLIDVFLSIFCFVLC
jgi:hypothetical protein